MAWHGWHASVMLIMLVNNMPARFIEIVDLVEFESSS